MGRKSREKEEGKEDSWRVNNAASAREHAVEPVGVPKLIPSPCSVVM